MTVITSKQIRELMDKNNIFCEITQIADKEYSLPDKNWILTEFSISWNSLQKFLEIKEWNDETNDCDDFARGAAFLAQTLHSRHKLKTGLAFGEFYFHSDVVKGPHAINFFFYKENEELKLGFYEPQTYLECQLTEIERAKCFYWRI